MVCGVSGSGKTSLVRHSLFPLAAELLGKRVDSEVSCEGARLAPKPLVRSFSDILLMSQEPIGRSTRSNIATYLGIFDEIRKIFPNY